MYRPLEEYRSASQSHGNDSRTSKICPTFSKQTFDWCSDLSQARISTLKVFDVNYQECLLTNKRMPIFEMKLMGYYTSFRTGTYSRNSVDAAAMLFYLLTCGKAIADWLLGMRN